jgi:hypothetical protein
MNKSNEVSPINPKINELQFQDELDESDRFKDASLLIYEKNSQLYKLQFGNQSQKNKINVVNKKDELSEVNKNYQESKVCIIV